MAKVLYCFREKLREAVIRVRQGRHFRLFRQGRLFRQIILVFVFGGFGAGFFAGAAGWGDVAEAEDVAMGDEEDSREGGTEDVTYHAREPDAGNTVAARAVDEARDDERERDEEDDLAGEASDDGNPGLVDRLEELRIGDCKGDKRGESHEVAKGRDADSEDGLLGIEAADDEPNLKKFKFKL